MSCGIKNLIQKIYDFRSQNLQFLYCIYFRSTVFNDLYVINIKFTISEENEENEFYFQIKYPSRLNIIDNGEELIENVIWLKEESLNPTIATNAILYHITGINNLRENIYNELVSISDQLKPYHL